jgi:ParB family chromosome partitioning protein
MPGLDVIARHRLTKRRSTVVSSANRYPKAADCMYTTQVQCSEIRPDPRSAGYLPHEVEALADSIRQHGLLRPVLLRASSKGYVIVHGERRWRASQMVGLVEVPAIIVEDVTREVSTAAAPGLRDGFAAAGTEREPATFDD